VTDPATAAGLVIGGKKTLLGVLGMAAAIAPGGDAKGSGPIVAAVLLSILVPLSASAFFMGQMSEKMDSMPDAMDARIQPIVEKLDTVYTALMRDGVFTEDAGDKLEDDFDRRCDAMHDRVLTLEHNCNNTRDKVKKLEQIMHAAHPMGNGNGG